MNSQERRFGGAKLAPYGLLALVCLLIPLVHVWLQTQLPSDGARIDKLLDVWTTEGVHLHVYDPSRAGLQDGDLLVAVNGVSPLAFKVGSAPVRQDGAPLEYQIVRNGQTLTREVGPGPQPVAAILRRYWGVILFTVVFQILGIFVLLRRPQDPAAQTMFIWGFTNSHFYIWSFYLQVPDLLSPLHFWYYILGGALLWWGSWAASVHMAWMFPKPLPIVQKRPGLVWLPYGIIFSLVAVFMLANRAISTSYAQWFKHLQLVEGLGSAFIFLISFSIILYQYHRARDEANKRKIRLVVFSAALAGGITVSLYLIPMALGLPVVDTNIIGVVMLLFPLSIAVAIWRYQLFDIDRIIQRTAVYSLLTAILVLVYFASVVALQSLFALLTGRAGESPAAVVISTLISAALFNPLRRKLQAGIDRRFYRRHYDAEQTLERFSAGLRSEVDLDEVSASILEVVKTTVQPEFTSLWLFKGK